MHPDWTNLQVREALIKTADRSLAPDNQYGYGVVNATRAAFFQQQMDCQTNCQDGTCQNNVCICNAGAYNLWCDGKRGSLMSIICLLVDLFLLISLLSGVLGVL